MTNDRWRYFQYGLRANNLVHLKSPVLLLHSESAPTHPPQILAITTAFTPANDRLTRQFLKTTVIEFWCGNLYCRIAARMKILTNVKNLTTPN